MPVGDGKEGFVGFAMMVATKAIPERTMFTLEGLPGDLEETFRQDIPGAGLGMTIAYEIVSRAGGRIEIANRPGGGLVQTVELPEAVDEAKT